MLLKKPKSRSIPSAPITRPCLPLRQICLPIEIIRISESWQNRPAGECSSPVTQKTWRKPSSKSVKSCAAGTLFLTSPQISRLTAVIDKSKSKREKWGQNWRFVHEKDITQEPRLGSVPIPQKKFAHRPCDKSTLQVPGSTTHPSRRSCRLGCGIATAHRRVAVVQRIGVDTVWRDASGSVMATR
jgi:hypothetical protein